MNNNLNEIFTNTANSIKSLTGSETVKPKEFSSQLDTISGIVFKDDLIYVGEDEPDATKYKYWINAPKNKLEYITDNKIQETINNNVFTNIAIVPKDEYKLILNQYYSGMCYYFVHYKDNLYITNCTDREGIYLVEVSPQCKRLYKVIKQIHTLSGLRSTAIIEGDTLYYTSATNYHVFILHKYNLLTDEDEEVYTSTYTIGCPYGPLSYKKIDENTEKFSVYIDFISGATKSPSKILIVTHDLVNNTFITELLDNISDKSKFGCYFYERMTSSDNIDRYFIYSSAGTCYIYTPPTSADTPTMENIGNNLAYSHGFTIDNGTVYFFYDDFSIMKYDLDTNQIVPTGKTYSNNIINSRYYIPLSEYNEVTNELTTINTDFVYNNKKPMSYYIDSNNYYINKVETNRDITENDVVLYEANDSTNKVIISASNSKNFNTHDMYRLYLSENQFIPISSQAVSSHKEYTIKKSDGTSFVDFDEMNDRFSMR